MIMSILTRLLGSKSRPTVTDGQPPSARTLVKDRIAPWDKIGPTVADAIFEALAGTELFDCFVLSSMEENLVHQYEKLGRADQNLSVIRAKISEILCQAGFQKLALLDKEINSGSAREIGFAAINLFGPAIAMSKDQIAGYVGMAAIYELLGVKAQCREYAKRGLLEVRNVRQSAAGQTMRDSGAFPPGKLDQAERELHGYLE
jgi:hypothetical protein